MEDIFLESYLNAKKPVGSMSAKYVAHMFPFISFPSSDWHINHRVIGIRLKVDIIDSATAFSLFQSRNKDKRIMILDISQF